MAQRLVQIWRTLQSVSAGHSLVEKAQRLWKLESDTDFLKHLKLGTSSRTDAVLTRHFSPQTGKEVREREVIIYLRENQSDVELLLDLSHELVHATSRAGFDPYDPTLSAVRYIRAAIDGEGGEVDAVLAECSIAQEMAVEWGDRVHRCRRYLDSGASPRSGVDPISRDRVAQDFYRVGKWLNEIQKVLGSEAGLLALLKGETPRLLSSSAHVPYPVALYQEYEELTQVACRNSLERKRSLELKMSEKGPTRDPDLEQLLAARCRDGISVAAK
jgi:hypothetical protein